MKKTGRIIQYFLTDVSNGFQYQLLNYRCKYASCSMSRFFFLSFSIFMTSCLTLAFSKSRKCRNGLSRLLIYHLKARKIVIIFLIVLLTYSAVYSQRGEESTKHGYQVEIVRIFLRNCGNCVPNIRSCRWVQRLQSCGQLQKYKFIHLVISMYTREK